MPKILHIFFKDKDAITDILYILRKYINGPVFKYEDNFYACKVKNKKISNELISLVESLGGELHLLEADFADNKS